MRGHYRDFFWHSVSKMTRSLLTALAATAFLAFSPLLFADTDEPPLHVATHGADVGDCLGEASPCRSIDNALRRVGMSISRRRILRPALHSRLTAPYSLSPAPIIPTAAWGTYPFLPSGNVLISDIDSGFYLVEDNT
jgi:hypothetical protein